MHPEKKRTLTMLAFLYGMAMVFLLFLRRPDMAPLPYSVRLRRHVNAIPFRVIKNYWRIFTRPVNRTYLPYALTNFLGNILLFVPMGFFPPALCSSLRKFYRTLLLVLTVITAVEVLQMLLLVGTCDVDDLILNLSGASLGYILFKCVQGKLTAPAAPDTPDAPG